MPSFDTVKTPTISVSKAYTMNTSLADQPSNQIPYTGMSFTPIKKGLKAEAFG